MTGHAHPHAVGDAPVIGHGQAPAMAGVGELAGGGEVGEVGEVIGLVDGRPVAREALDQRVRELREGPLRATLPAPGTSEDRQLARWLTQVILTEVLCEREAAARGLAPVEGRLLDRVAAVELGSINAAAYNNSPWVRTVFADVTATAEVPAAWRSPAARRDDRPALPSPVAGRDEQRHLVWHGLFDDPAAADAATVDDLEPLGVVTLGSLPAAVAGALRRVPYGMVARVEDALGRHVAVARPAPDPAPQDDPAPAAEVARRRMFARRLDEMRAERVELVSGLEHPGDPRQPDNHHKH